MYRKKSEENYHWVIDSWCHCFCNGAQNFWYLRNKKEIKQSAKTIT